MVTAFRVALLSRPSGPATVTGVASSAFGAQTGTAVGTRTVLGVAVSTFGGQTGTAVGTKTVYGVAVSTFGGLTGTATSGAGTVTGAASALLGSLLGQATGTRTVYATAGQAFGGLTGTAVVSLLGSGVRTITVTAKGARRILTTDGRVVTTIPARAGETTTPTVVLYTDAAVAWTSSVPATVTWGAVHADGSTLTGTGTAAANGVVVLTITPGGTATVGLWSATVQTDSKTWPTDTTRDDITLKVLANV